MLGFSPTAIPDLQASCTDPGRLADLATQQPGALLPPDIHPP